MARLKLTTRLRTSTARQGARILPLAVLAACLAGCGAVIADLPLVGLPADAPPRKPRGSFLPVNDLPGQRDTKMIETPEQAKIRADLATARDQQAAAAAAAAK